MRPTIEYYSRKGYEALLEEKKETKNIEMEKIERKNEKTFKNIWLSSPRWSLFTDSYTPLYFIYIL